MTGWPWPSRSWTPARCVPCAAVQPVSQPFIETSILPGSSAAVQSAGSMQTCLLRIAAEAARRPRTDACSASSLRVTIGPRLHFQLPQVERGLACAPGSVPTFSAAVAAVEKIRFFAGGEQDAHSNSPAQMHQRSHASPASLPVPPLMLWTPPLRAQQECRVLRIWKSQGA